MNDARATNCSRPRNHSVCLRTHSGPGPQRRIARIRPGAQYASLRVRSSVVRPDDGALGSSADSELFTVQEAAQFSSARIVDL